MNAILIARVSTEEQKEAGNSLPAQVVRLEKYCNNKGFKIAQVCSFDESAYTDDRSEFDKIIDLILNQKEKIAVCADKVDRLSRNVFDKRMSVLYEKALKDELELHFVSDGQIITSRISAAEKFQFSINLGLAKYYSDAISDNVKRAMEQKLRKGEWVSKAPYGYKNITKPGGVADVMIDEYQAQIVKKSFDLYTTGAYSMNIICEQIKKEHGIDWPRGSLGKILSNRFYYGIMFVNGKEYPHRYPTIITQAIFDQAKQIRIGFKKQPTKLLGNLFLYRGVFRCGDCGLCITPEKHKGFNYYHCTQYRGKHDAKWFREEKITEELGKVFKKIQLPKDVLAEFVDSLNSLNQARIDFQNKELGKLQGSQKTLNQMLDNLYLDKLKGRITDSEYDRFYQSLNNQLNEISIKLENFKEAEENYYITTKHLLDLTSRAYDLFLSSEVIQRRQLIKLVLSNLRIENGSVLYDVVKPFDLIINSYDRKLWRD